MSNLSVSDLSPEKKMFAMLIAIKNANEEMQRRLQFFEESAAGGPARYTQGISAVMYGVDYNYSPQVNFYPSLINLDSWIADAVRYASEFEHTYPNEDDDVYAQVLRRCVENMIYKTQNSCLNIGSIQVVIIGQILQGIIDFNDYDLCSSVIDLISLFTGCTETYASYSDYIQKRST